VDSAYGTSELLLGKGTLKLKLSAHPKLIGIVTHWHYDTFVATWNHRLWQKSDVTFTLDKQGKASRFTIAIRPEWIDTREYVFTRIGPR